MNQQDLFHSLFCASSADDLKRFGLTERLLSFLPSCKKVGLTDIHTKWTEELTEEG